VQNLLKNQINLNEMTKFLTLILISTFFYSCKNSRENENFEEKSITTKMKTDSINSNNYELQKELIIHKDSSVKNYVTISNQNIRKYKYGLIKIEKSSILYRDDNIAWLQLSLRNNLSDDIKSILIKIHSVDCNYEKDDYIEEKIDIKSDSLKNFEIQISSQIYRDKIKNCYKHPPEITISEAIISSGEKYPNTKDRNYIKE
jgi:hypothetical protein